MTLKRTPEPKMESEKWAVVIPDTRDGRKDYLIPRAEAVHLYKEGKPIST